MLWFWKKLIIARLDAIILKCIKFLWFTHTPNKKKTNNTIVFALLGNYIKNQ